MDGAAERGAPALPPLPVDWGAPVDTSLRRPLSHVGKTALFALDILREIEQMNAARCNGTTGGSAPLAMRIGLHAGDAVGGIVGTSRPRYFIWGPETVVANKLESSGKAGQILVSEAVARRLYSEGFLLRPRQEEGGAFRDFFLDSFQFERTTEHGHAELIDVKVACE